MMRRIIFHPAARREYAAAIKHAERERPGRGQRLQTEVERTAARIAEAPEQGSPYLHGTRRFVLLQFPLQHRFRDAGGRRHCRPGT